MNNIYTIISIQETYTHYSRCGYEGTYDGSTKQKWFSDLNLAIEYLADLKIKDKYVIPESENPYSFEHTVYINGMSSNNDSDITLDDESWDALLKLENDFEYALDQKFEGMETKFLADRKAKLEEEARIHDEQWEKSVKEQAERQREADLETLARLQKQYG